MRYLGPNNHGIEITNIDVYCYQNRCRIYLDEHYDCDRENVLYMIELRINKNNIIRES